MGREPIEPRDPRPPGEPYERRTEVIEERSPEGPQRPPPWWRESWWLLGLLGVVVLGGVLALLFLGGDDEDGRTDARPTTTVTVETETEPDVETETEAATTTVTTAPEQVSVPDAIGQDHVGAGAAVDDVGLVADTFPVPSDEPRGTVVAQNPDPGTELAEGSPVRLNVSLGPASRPTGEIPDVTGPAAADARARCREANFTCLTRETAAPSAEEVGEVVDQEPAAGSPAEVLTQITLFVGR